MSNLNIPWPPELADDESILYEGKFSADVWLKRNVFPVLAVVAILTGILTLSGRMAPAGIGYLCLLAAFGIVIAGLIYRRQMWQITDKAIYVRHRTPVPLTAVRKVRGFGGTIRFIQAWGMSTQILGVENAAEIRLRMLRGGLA